MITSLWKEVEASKKNIAIDFYMSQKLGDVTLASPTSFGNTTVTLEAGHGTQVGEYLEFWEGKNYIQLEVTAVNGNVISLQSPLASTYTTNAVVKRVNIDLNINAAVGLTFFSFINYSPSSIVQLISLRGVIYHATEAHDGLFGDQTALADGCILASARTFQGELNYTYLWPTILSNRNIRLHSSMFEYGSAGINNQYYTEFQRDFVEENKANVLLYGSEQDQIFFALRDNLSALSGFRLLFSGNIYFI